MSMDITEFVNSIKEIEKCSINPNSDFILNNAKFLLKFYEFKLQKSLIQNIKSFCEKNKISIEIFFQTILLEYLTIINSIEYLTSMAVIHKNDKNSTKFSNFNTKILAIEINPTNDFINIVEKINTFSKNFNFDMNTFRSIYNKKYHYKENIFNVAYSFNTIENDLKDYCQENQYEFIMNFDHNKEQLNILYNEKLFSMKELTIIMERILYLIQQNLEIISERYIKFNELSILSPSEKDLIESFNFNDSCQNKLFFNSIKSSNKNERKPDIDILKDNAYQGFNSLTIIDVFNYVVENFPTKVAVNDSFYSLTYKELNEKSNSIANILYSKFQKLSDKSVNDIIIPIISKKNWQCIVSIYGILKSGAVCLLVDPSNDIFERLDYLIKEIEIPILFYDDEVIDINKLSEQHSDIEFISLKKFDYNYDIKNVTYCKKVDDNAFLFFTSGSTGKPKGVFIKEKAIINLEKYIYDNAMNAPKKELSISSIGFIAFILEILISIFLVTEMYIVSDEKRLNIPYMLATIANAGIDNLFTTPSYFNILINADAKDKFKNIKCLKYVTFLGESLNNLSNKSKEFIKNNREQLNCSLIFGSTEGLMISTKPFIEDISSSVGKSVYNINAYILNNEEELCPIGVEGELCISGVGVANEYAYFEEKNQSSFIKNPFNQTNDPNHEIIFKTGDMCKWNVQGEIEYINRKDNQIKIKGRRIELEEVEIAMKKHPLIESCVVAKKVVNRDDSLVGYYISKENISYSDLKEYLSNHLSGFKIPNYFVKLNEFIYNNSGKIDRKNFPDPTLDDILISNYIPLETETEIKLSKIFSKVFRIKENKIGRNSNFNELGGDSIKGVIILSELQNIFKLKLNISDLIKYGNIESLGKYIDKSLKENIESNDKSKLINNKNDQFPLTSQQMEIYIDCIKNENEINYNISNIYKLNSNIKKEVLKKSIMRLLEKYSILKSYIYNDDEAKVYLKINKDMAIQFEEYEWNNILDFVKPFNLKTGPLIRFGFIKDDYLLVDVHHIIFDGYSINIFIKEINKIYHDISFNNTNINDYSNRNNESDVVNEKDMSYQEYSLLMNEKNDKFEKQIKFYQELFKNEELNKLSLPSNSINTNTSTNNNNNSSSDNEIDNKHSKRYNNQYEMCKRKIAKDISNEIEKYTQRNGISKTAFFITIYGYIMSKYSGSKNIYTGITDINRNNSQLYNTIGLFVKTHPLLLKYNEKVSLETYMKKNMKLIQNIINDYPLSLFDIMKNINIPKMNNLFTYQPYILVEDDKIENGNAIEFGNIDEIVKKQSSIQKNHFYNNNFNSLDRLFNINHLKLDMTFSVFEYKENFEFNIKYNENIYDKDMINNICESFIEILQHIDNYSKSINGIDYIKPDMYQKIINEFSSNPLEYNINYLYHETIHRNAVNHPNKTAIIFNNQKISYKEIDEMSNSLARYLRKIGIKRNDIIPIISERTYYYVIGILGISKAGGAFLPIDPEFPEERINYMINEVKPKCILKCLESEIKNYNKDFGSYKIIDLIQINYNENKKPLGNINRINDKCYVMFTSGTTGKPKGIIIRHDNILNYCMQENIFDFKDKEITINNVLGFTKFTFDMSLVEVLATLFKNKTIVLCNDLEYTNPSAVSKLINKYNIDFINTTTTKMKLFIKNRLFKKSLSNIKLIEFCGEMVTNDVVLSLRKCTNALILNEYGPTECTLMSTVKDITDISERSIVTIGKPIINHEIYILDSNLNPVPVGVEGEIYIGGKGVGDGYLNRNDLTNEKYIINKFKNKNDKCNIMYRSGDIGKWTKEGEIICLGRNDQQVKINGQRIELEEIENTMKEINEIDNAVAAIKYNDENEKYLVGYYIIKKGMEIEKMSIRNHLIQKLPNYMVPSYFIEINSIPLNNSSKLDRNSLPVPNENDLINKQYIKPDNEIEIKLCNIYSKLLHVPLNKIGKLSDFYELGGNSINAIYMISEIQKELLINISMKDIMKHSTIKSLSQLINNKINNRDDNKRSFDIIKKNNKKEYPITSQQMGIYVDCMKEENIINYNISEIFKLSENIDKEKLKKSIMKLVDNHEIFKSKFGMKEVNGISEVCGIIDDNFNIEFEEYHYDNIDDFVRPFKLNEGKLIRIGFISNEYLLLDIHHIIFDGFSRNLFIKELYDIYQGEVITENEIEYTDYAIYINEKMKEGAFEKEIEFYKNMFENKEVELLKLPMKSINDTFTDKEIKSENIKISNNINISYNIYKKFISRDDAIRINQYIKNKKISNTSFFFTLYGYIMSKYANQSSIYTSIMHANRNNININMIGMFVGTLPLLLKYDKNISLEEYIKLVMNDLNNILENNHISFREIMKSTNIPSINNSFVYQPKSTIKEFNSSGSIINDYDFNDSNAFKDEHLLFNNNKLKFDLTFSIIENNTDYQVMIEYNKYKYDLSLIENIVDSYIELIHQIDEYSYPISEIQYITSDMYDKIINEFSSNPLEYNINYLYHETIHRNAVNHPNKTAIIFNNQKISYKEIDEMSNSLARYLRKIGIKRNDIIPIISERTYYYVIGILGISKAGGAFFPIDPEFPEERINYMINEVNPKFILKYSKNIDKNSLSYLFKNYKFINLETFNYKKNTETLGNINRIEDICYIMFTSGTTGKPKGNLIRHSNFLNYCFQSHLFNFQNNSNSFTTNNILGFTKFTFDMSLAETLCALFNNKCTILTNDIEFNNPQLLSQLITQYNVDYIDTTPTKIKLFVKNKDFTRSLKNVKVIKLGGEMLSKETVKKLKEYTNALIFNEYGPTECTLMSSSKDVTNISKNTIITIGKPMDNYQLYILDSYLNPVPIGVVGDIYIGGQGVGSGYLNRKELTSKVFLINKFTKGSNIKNMTNNVNRSNTNNNNNPKKIIDNNKHNIMYKSGDLGKWNNDGEIICLGRKDFQVKIHGQRIELGEIEEVMKEMNEIENAVVTDKKNNDDGDKYLVGYYIVKEGRVINKNDIRNNLKKKLPNYMIPNYFIQLKKIPLSMNGKLDRKALPEPTEDDLILNEYIPPCTPTEKKLSSMFSTLLNINETKIGKLSDFFELGGNSFIAIRLIAEIQKEFLINISINNIMKYPTIESLSYEIDLLQQSTDPESKFVHIKKYNSTEYPIISQQLDIKTVKIKNNTEYTKSTYDNSMVALKLSPKIDMQKLKRALCKLFDRHEVLKTKYKIKMENGKLRYYGYIDKDAKLTFEYYSREEKEQLVKKIDLFNEVLTKVAFIDNEILFITINHTLFDGYSKNILINDLYRLYYDIPLPELNIQYSDYALDKEEKLKNGQLDYQFKYYEKIYKNKKFIKTISKPVASHDYRNCNFIIDESLSKKLHNYINENNIAVAPLLFTLFTIAIEKYIYKNDVYISILNTGRNNFYKERLIGQFGNRSPLLIDVDRNKSVLDLIKDNFKILMDIRNFDLSFSDLENKFNIKESNCFFLYNSNYRDKKEKDIDIFSTLTGDEGSKNRNDPNFFIRHKQKNGVFSQANIKLIVIEINNIYKNICTYNYSKYDSEALTNVHNYYRFLLNHTEYFDKTLNEISEIFERNKDLYISELFIRSPMGPMGPFNPGQMGNRPMGPMGPMGPFNPGQMGNRPMGPMGQFNPDNKIKGSMDIIKTDTQQNNQFNKEIKNLNYLNYKKDINKNN